MNIQTSRCKIRNMKIEDAADLHEVLSDAETMKYIEPPFTLKQTEEFIEEAGMCEPPLVYALELRSTGRVIGHVIFHPYEKDSYEIGWIINRKYWGMGIAGEITEVLIDYARAEKIPYCVIECDPEQEATKAIALKYGFSYEGIEDELSVYRLKTNFAIMS